MKARPHQQSFLPNSVLMWGESYIIIVSYSSWFIYIYIYYVYITYILRIYYVYIYNIHIDSYRIYNNIPRVPNFQWFSSRESPLRMFRELRDVHVARQYFTGGHPQNHVGQFVCLEHFGYSTIHTKFRMTIVNYSKLVIP